MRTIEVSRTTAAAPHAAIDAIWAGAEWRATWNGVRAFCVEYDDAVHQAARVLVDWNGKPLTLSLMRFRDHPGQISFFCPQPPHPLASQTGRWVAVEEKAGTRITAIRHIQLSRLPGEAAQQYELRFDRYEAALTYRLGRILEAFDSRAAAASGGRA